ncbi:MAG: phosphoenolpyruvate--protein phosphotransferase [Actinobacteria bacterium]|nr:phosphoenolpyruvate--protein phosphotransferase [Actinomycetota bacterium]
MTGVRKKIRGLPVSPGTAIGKVCIIGTSHVVKKQRIRHKDVKGELEKFKDALKLTRFELEQLKEKVSVSIGKNEADIFDVQILLTEDPYLTAQIEHKVAVEHKNLAWAVEETLQDSISSLQKIDDTYMRERAADLRDVASRILEKITESQRECFIDENTDIILASENLLPSQTVGMHTKRIRGFITEHGGATSHAAILARSLGVPLVSGILDLVRVIPFGAIAIVDGFRGEVILNPSQDRIRYFQKLQKTILQREKQTEKLAKLPAVTKDKVEIKLMANIGSLEDALHAIKLGAEGVGLYRTELHFMERQSYGSEEDQYLDYKNIAQKMFPHPVVIRTLDIGGDKYLHTDLSYKEPNPYLGLRAIRISLRDPDIFKTQLRAIFRAATLGNIKLMLPMISSVEEILAAQKIIRATLKELKKAGIEHNPKVPLGMMIEIPSAAINIRSFLKIVDFVSVGTNDLVQYTLAVDRGNEQVSSLYQPFHPAILSLLEIIGRAGRELGKETSVCGEIAGDPLFTELLVGFGFRNLSMSAPFIPHVKLRVRQLYTDECKKSSQKVLKFSLSSEIRKYVEKQLEANHFAK